MLFTETTEFPRQKISYAMKTAPSFDDHDRSWGEMCINAIVKLAGTSNTGIGYNNNFKRSSYQNKLRNYKLFNNIIDNIDVSHVVNPFPDLVIDEKKLKTAAVIQPYDLISPFFYLLMGEETKRYFDPLVVVTNPEAIQEKLEEKNTFILNLIQQHLTISVQNIPEEEKQQALQLIEKKLKELSYTNFRSKKEIQASHLLNYLLNNTNVKKEFLKGIKDVFLASEETYRIDEVGGEPYAYRVNPLTLWAELANNEFNMSKAEKICQMEKLPIGKIIDEFYEYLTPAQITELEKKIYHPGSSMPVFSVGDYYSQIPVVESIGELEKTSGPGIFVYRCRWKSMKKQGIFHFIDQEGNEQTEYVDETFEVPDPQDITQWIEWFWIPEYWKGTRIGDDMFINVSPMTTRYGSVSKLSECKSGFSGYIYNADNAPACSMMDRLVPWIYLHIVTTIRLEEAMAKSYGHIAELDLASMPDGWSPEKTLWYGAKLGFMFKNSFNEGKKGAAQGKIIGGQSGHVGNQALNLSNMQDIEGYLEILRYIEERVGYTAGIPPQRLGQITSEEAVGNTERTVNQSSHITELTFRLHNDVKIETLEMMLEVAKDNLLDSKILQYTSDDTSVTMAQIDPDVSYHSYSIYVSDNAKDQQNYNDIKALLAEAIKNEKVEIGEVASALASKSINELITKLKKADEIKRENAQAQQDAQNKLEQQKLDIMHEQMQNDNMNKQLDRENKLAIAEMQSLAIDEGSSTGPIIDVVKNSLEQQKLTNEYLAKQKELTIKEKELQLKNKQHDDNIKVEKENMTNDLQIARINSKNRSKTK